MTRLPLSDALLEEASQWIARLHSGQCTQLHLRAMDHWRSRSESHQAAFEAAESLWQELGGLTPLAGPQLAAARQYLQSAGRGHRKVRRLRHLTTAAVVLLAILATPSAWLLWNTQTYATAKGQRLRVELSDGSAIELNTDTAIQVSLSPWHRTAKLERGEALFSVLHDEKRPFEVVTAGGHLRDIGTRFNVYRQHERVLVSVLEGEVEVETAGGSARVTPGLQLDYDAAGRLSPARAVDAEALVAWREGKMRFKSQPLSEVLAQLSRYHNVVLSLQEPGLAATPVSGTFPVDDLPLALDTISAALALRSREAGPGHIRLERNPSAGR